MKGCVNIGQYVELKRKFKHQGLNLDFKPATSAIDQIALIGNHSNFYKPICVLERAYNGMKRKDIDKNCGL